MARIIDHIKQVAPVSERLREAMELRGKKQIDLANETGIDKDSISHYLSGSYVPKKGSLVKLAAALNVSEAWLSGYDAPFRQSIANTAAPVISSEEGYIHVLRGLISYHERMTMGAYPERDFYLDALRFALRAVEENVKKEVVFVNEPFRC